MKKIFSALLVALFLIIATPAQAQLHFGVKGGLNLSKASFSKDMFKGDNQTGFFIGPMAEFTVPIIGIGADIAALYSQTKLDAGAETAKLKTIEIPVNLKWSFGLGSVLGLYVAAGPQFGFNIGNSWDSWYQLKKNNTTFNVGAGVKLLRHLQAGVNYNFALSHTATFTSDINGNPAPQEIKVKNNTWQISVAYIF